jgi:hypothetical protein
MHSNWANSEAIVVSSLLKISKKKKRKVEEKRSEEEVKKKTFEAEATLPKRFIDAKKNDISYGRRFNLV